MSTIGYTIGIATIVLAVAFQFGLFMYAVRRGLYFGQPPGRVMLPAGRFAARNAALPSTRARRVSFV